MARTNRRRFLQIAGAGLALGLAGCSSGESTTDSSNGEAGNESGTDAEPTDNSSGGAGDEETETNGTGGNETDSHDHEGVPDGPSPTAAVAMASGDRGTHFDPDVVWVEAGGTVEWTLESGTHTTTAYHPDADRSLRIPEGAEPWDSGILSEGDATFSHTFETEGVYDYYCQPHEAMGMIGSVIVGSPDPEGQPGLAPPEEDLPEAAREKIEHLNERVATALGGAE